ncbi:MAG: nucleotidyltransferase domain-containing protein [Methanomicrobiales archaeon]|nr:nucleotidyltransferase domain-containing protein [Methanomicrobiales archaeon]
MRENLKTAVLHLVTREEVLEVILFGSFAEDLDVPGSDVDVMIVELAESHVRFIRRIEEYSPYFEEVGLAVDVFPYTQEEMDTTLARRAQESGVVMFRRG